MAFVLALRLPGQQATDASGLFPRGAKHTMNLTPEIEKQVAECLAKPRGKYSGLMNNCATPVQECLRESGLRMPPNNLILPESLNHLMWWMLDSSEVIERNSR